MAAPKKVLIIDDSALVREFLHQTLDSDPSLKVVGAAADPIFARDKIKKLQPDVITLDIEMPRMDGLTFLKRLMAAHPIPVVMFSSHTEAGAAATLEALAAGAVDFVAKPKHNLVAALPQLKQELIEKVKSAAQAKIRPRLKPIAPRPKPVASRPTPSLQRYSAEAVVPKPKRAAAVAPSKDKVVVIGASTGGTVALEEILTALPAHTPPIAVVQHMPPHFTKAFANRLNEFCAMEIAEAVNGQRLTPGLVLIAPGGSHMLLQRDASGYLVEVKDGPPVNRHKPSVDVLFRSAVNSAGPNALGILLTGMGDDGAKGLKELHDAGAKTIAQDEATSVVYGMPRVAVELGAADVVLPLSKMPQNILQHV